MIYDKNSRHSNLARRFRAERRVAGRVVLFVCFLSFSAGLTGCVYYNLFYNTKRAYEAAEEVPLQPDGTLNRTAVQGYQQVITKCNKLIEEHPDSKYVDDALLLLGKSHYMREEYPEAIDALSRLQEEHPESDLLVEGRLYLSKALVEQGERGQAVAQLQSLIEDKPKGKYAPEVLYLLGTNLIRMGRDDEAFTYLERLATDYPRTKYRVEADLEIATMFMDRGNYQRSLRIFQRLGKRELERPDMMRYYVGLAELRAKMGQYGKSLEAVSFLDDKPMGDYLRAQTLLLKGEAYAGLDSTNKAVDLYETVVARYPKSKFSADASFRLGVIFHEKLNKLDEAKRYYDEVPRQFPKSELAPEAIQRSVSITKIKRLESSLQGAEVESAASVKFELAETQLFQFKDVDKALAGYAEVLDNYPSSAVAPKAAYAIGYIYSDVLKDVDKARLAYQRVIDDYPDSQQAQYARTYIEEHTAQLESRNE